MTFSLFRRDFIAAGVLSAGAGLSGAAIKSTTILVLGDSLSAEYGLKRGSGWVALLGNRLKAERLAVTLINASISGDTASGGRSRLDGLLRQYRPTQVILELGANDALRGLPLELTRHELNQMTRSAQRAGAKVLLLGMQMPPNYGKDYGARFAAMYAEVARSNKAALVPFLLKGVADVPQSAALFQADGIHPTENAQPIMLDNVWPELQRLLR